MSSTVRIKPATNERHAPAGAWTIPGQPHLKALVQSPMSLHTTWRIGGPADLLVRVPTQQDLIAAMAWARDQGLPVTVIGGGSNLLVGDRGIRGLVILARTPGERAERLLHVEDREDHVILRVGAQAPLSWVGRYCCERGWAGMEWGVGLPGTIGGATVNNAGAHGTEQKDHLEGVVVIDNVGELREFGRDWLAPRYRCTVLKESPRPRPYHVVETVLRLPKTDPAELLRLATEHADYRRQTQPTGACAGSTFTNPPDDFAGRPPRSGRPSKGLPSAARPSRPSTAISSSTPAARPPPTSASSSRSRQTRVRDRFGIELQPEIEEIGEP